MISIITAVYNQIGLNKIFYESLMKHTFHPFELIIIDNGSTDGSIEYFKSVGATVIENDGNYSYPYCQNQGIEAASMEMLAFLNNDLMVSPNWDKQLFEAMKANGLDIITPCGIEQVESATNTKKIRKRWHFIKYTVGSFAKNYHSFKLMHQLMYGNWEKFCAERQSRFGTKVIEGFVGNTVLMTRKAIELLGKWDERVQSGDFDLYMRSKIRSIEHGDIKPMHIALGTFIHHYIRITSKSKPPVFKDAHQLITFDEKWNEKQRKLYLQDIL
jgi:GT2 family glycosyltransferase